MTDTTKTRDGEGTAMEERPETPSSSEIQRIREAGELRKERKKEIKEIATAIKGLQFGNVDGAHMSPETRWQVAKMCQVTGANPLTHIDILGDTIYHNAEYWSDVLNTHPLYLKHEQREISEANQQTLENKAEELEERAEGIREKAEKLDSEKLCKKALDLVVRSEELREEADEIELARSNYGVPEWPSDVVETTIYRLVQSAPVEEIRKGEVDAGPFVITVSECNWAGGYGEYLDENNLSGPAYGKDPIGDANPAKTARTRSLRRAARRAFSEWMEQYQEQIERAEEAAARDFELIEASAESRPGPGERQAIAGESGEPEATTDDGASDLPVTNGDESDGTPSGGEEEPEPAPPQASATPPEGGGENEPSTEELIDRERRAYFANLRDGPGIEDDEERHTWQEEHDLPASTTDWSLDQWRRANSILTAEAKASYKQACNALGVDPDEYARDMLDRPAKMISDFEQLTTKLSAEADQEAAEASEQEELL